MRRRLALLAIALLAGCATSVTVLLGEAQQPLRFEGGRSFVPHEDGDVVLIGAEDLLRIDAAGHVSSMLEAPVSDVLDVAFAEDDCLLVLRPDGISSFFADKLLGVWPVQASARSRLAADDGAVWLSLSEDGRGRLVRVDPATKALCVALDVDVEIDALAAGPDGCYFATRDTVWRLVTHEDGQGDVIFVLSLPGALVTSIAADADHELLYVATAETTFFYAEGRVRPLYARGGVVRTTPDGALLVSSARERVLVRVPDPAGMAAAIAAADSDG
jgi:hypothetical protein